MYLVFHYVLHSEGCVARHSVLPCSVLCIKQDINYLVHCMHVYFCVIHPYYSQCTLVSLVEVRSHIFTTAHPSHHTAVLLIAFLRQCGSEFLNCHLGFREGLHHQRKRKKGVNKPCSTSLIHSPYLCVLSPSNCLYSCPYVCLYWGKKYLIHKILLQNSTGTKTKNILKK